MKQNPSVLIGCLRWVYRAFAVLLGSLVLTGPAYAYLDPGTGTMIVQIILGGVAGLAVAGKLFWSQLTDFFRNLFGRAGSPRNETTSLPPDESNLDAGQVSEHNENKQ